MTAMLFRPLTTDSRMKRTWIDGRKTARIVDGFIKPNDRLTSFERLEIYNRQYWFRVLDAFYEDYPALRVVLGDRAFLRLAEAYLVSHPSSSFTMRNLGRRLEGFLRREPRWAGRKIRMALEVTRFEWAQVVAFDGEARPIVAFDKLGSLNPAELRLGLQPYITLLKLEYPVDRFALAVKEQATVRSEASNAVESRVKVVKLRRATLPLPERTYVAVHRHDHFLYYKRLEPEAYRILAALRRGLTLEQACQHGLRRASRSVDWEKKLETWFENWSALGWFCMAHS